MAELAGGRGSPETALTPTPSRVPPRGVAAAGALRLEGDPASAPAGDPRRAMALIALTP
ncbi:hypothetical protein SCATT_29870 [Streptantibioticus cattleyicolor NRRL 8057 = DSM 46488]|uniref:Uncharacterized protein n=1 Tax=Streptantibioticus cattleyicolor (strain ATCC 35852 / DSM 46488 / JCM 4925 / NBRC 14057 / NRRL 8057) TaxID=1003195 RepID=G8WSB7_STREN|nr:hypothetical protein SCATT_29870 [Streptantibioticus cattleyicolor NRRL 8057 = DSM 46488]